MNTFKLYEELRESLGDAAAKVLATTLGGMFEELKNTVTKEDFRALRTEIEGDVNRLENAIVHLAEAQQRTESRVEQLAEAQQRTEARVEQLAEAQQRTEARVEQLAEAQQRTEARVEQLAEAQQRTEARVEQLAEGQQRLVEAQQRTEARVEQLAEGQQRLVEAQRRTEARLAQLTEAQQHTEEALQRLSARTDKVVGDCFEQKFRDRLPAYLGLFLRRGRLVDVPDLVDQIEPSVSTSDLRDLLRADAIASGRIDGESVLVVIEASVTADAEDVIRAARRAGVLRQAGLQAIPLVACETAAEVTRRQARDADVRLWIDGSVIETAA